MIQFDGNFEIRFLDLLVLAKNLKFLLGPKIFLGSFQKHSALLGTCRCRHGRALRIFLCPAGHQFYDGRALQDTCNVEDICVDLELV